MLPHARKRHRRLGIYLIVTCLLLGGFLMRMWYGFDRPDKTTGVGDRIVRIEEWGYKFGPNLWSVGPHSIYAYRALDQSSIRVPLDSEAAVLIRGEVAKIPEVLRGTHTRNRSSCDGPNVGVSFTPDGEYRHDEISAYDVYMKDLEPLFAMINDLVPADFRIVYNSEIKRHHEEHNTSLDQIVRMTQSEFNRWNSSILPCPPPIVPVLVPAEEIFPRANENTLVGEPTKVL